MKNNKGVSVVALIIVIAIMAILVGVMAPQLIKYIEKTNVAADVQVCDTVRSALVTAAMDPDVVKHGGALKAGTSTTVKGCYNDGTDKEGTTFTYVLTDILGKDPDTVKDDLKSKKAKGNGISVQVGNTGNNVKVFATGDTDIYAGSATSKTTD